MDIVRITTYSLTALFVLAGCVQEEEALSGDPSNPINDNPPGDSTLMVTPPAAQQAEATGPMTMVSLGAASATGGDGSYTFTSDAPAQGFPLGATTVTWTATDGGGATGTATQTVTVADTTSPSITPPAHIQTVGTGAMTMVDIGAATATDLVDASPAVTNDMPAAGFPFGSTPVVWTATDASGNTSTATQMVTIATATSGPLTLTAPADITMEATGPTTNVMLGAAMAGGGTAPYSITSTAPSGGFPVAATTVTWTVVDADSATVTATQMVTVADTTAPSISAPADVTADQPAGGGNTVVDLGTPTFSDLVDPNPTVTNNAPAGGFPTGASVVTWTAEDASGNSAVDVQQVTINAFAAEQCSALVGEFTTVIYPLMNSSNPNTCVGCHTGSNPLPTANNFAFPNEPPTAADFDVFHTIAKIDSNGQSLITAKARNVASHVGGDRFPDGTNDPNFVQFAAFVDRAKACLTAPPTNPVTIELGTSYEQLHKIVSALGARVPTSDEVAAAEAAADQEALEMTLEAIADGLMNEAAFYTRVQEIYNDVFLTNKDARDRDPVRNNFDIDAFANRDYYEDNFSGTMRSDLREDANYGIARAPIELVKYVVENDLPFTEIVTADYTMVNPFAARVYDNVGPNGFAFDPSSNPNPDRDDFRPVTNLRQQDNTLVPAAGVVGTHAFLGRYLSTNTNVNRSRAAHTFKYFLGTDIEDLASRDGLDLDSVMGAVPTYEDPQCTVCHDVMDPIAGLFTKRDNGGEYDTNNTYQHTRTTMGVPRMVPAGYSMDPADELPTAQQNTPLQWLGGRIATDDRFADHTVRIVFEGLTGIEPAADATAFINTTKTRFIAANYDFKRIVKDIVTSEFFLAQNLATGENPNDYPDVGAGRLLTPEQLDRRITAIAGGGYVWNGPNSGGGLRNRHQLLYGGINSDDVVTRADEPTTLIDGIQERVANQVSCNLVADHLYNDGELFPFVDETITPETSAGEDAIRQNVQFLHRHLLGEDLELSDSELDTTFDLFVDVRDTGETSIRGACRGGGPSTDANGTVIPWQAVVTYLLSDYRFVYE